MGRIIKPPLWPIPMKEPGEHIVFLAGSIEMGLAEKWQETMGNVLSKYNLMVADPRRDDWDSSWIQSIDNPEFKQQVSWELAMLERADMILMYFDPNTKSPISLLELGLYARTSKEFAVCCPQGFWRKGNVDVVCERYEVNIVESLDALANFAIGLVT